MSKVCTIRPFQAERAEDYQTYCQIINAVYPEYPETPEEIQHGDQHRNPKLKNARFFAEVDGQTVGVADYSQWLGAYHPQKFGIGISVLPERQGQGIGSDLYDALMEALAPFDPIALRTNVREDHERGLRFVQDRGFVEDMREQESKIDLTSFEPEKFAADIAKTEASGITIRTTRELKDLDPDFVSKLEDLMWTVGMDIPRPESMEMTRPPLEEFVKRFDRPGFLWDGNFVALDGDRYAGVSVLHAAKATPDLFTGTTGVRREYRGKGIATALKVRALSWAKAQGAPFVRTWNEVNNNGMLGINFRLGFVRQPVWIDFSKTLKEDA